MEKFRKPFASAKLALSMGLLLMAWGSANALTTPLFETPTYDPQGDIMSFDYTSGGTVRVVDPYSIHTGEGYGYDRISSASQPANLEGAQLNNAWISYAGLDHANLSYANLAGTTFESTGFTSANLAYANLHDAFLDGAELDYADLTYANLDDIYMFYGTLSYANVVGASFLGADMSYCAGLAETVGSAYYDANTRLPSSFDPVAAGWILVPEPTTFSLLGLGSLALMMVRLRESLLRVQERPHQHGQR